MRCEFCGEEIETTPYQNDGMSFCSLECSDAMDSGEAIPVGEEILADPDEFDDDDDDDDDDEFDILDDDAYENEKEDAGVYGVEKEDDEFYDDPED
ncbi:MAG: hypothetical protein KAR42_07305 [candidate division Zixibacteria bacterium]|nr:hypothetical protein [candidate division Zixibacteria bacterium]